MTVKERRERQREALREEILNAAREGVEDRIEIQDGDARNMSFPDGCFDVVLSSWALHNIYNDAERAKALREIVRVLKPGGRAAIVDVWHAREYARFFEENGFTEVKLKGPNFLFVIPSFRVTGKKYLTDLTPLTRMIPLTYDC